MTLAGIESNRLSSVLLFCVSTTWVLHAAGSSHAQVVRGLQTVPAGTEVLDPDAERWNRLVLLATPVLSSGEVERIPPGVRNSVSRFSLTILATVAASQRPSSDGVETSQPNDESTETSEIIYRLVEVGLGYSTVVDSRRVVLDVEQAASLGANLDFFDRQILKRNVAALEKPQVIVRTATLMVFDVPAIMARDEGHRAEIMRHLVWANPRTGKLAAAVWMIRRVGGTSREAGNSGARNGGQQSLQVVSSDPIRILPSGMRETREIHVDGDGFILGIPTQEAFALEGLPPGKPIVWNDQLRRLAGRSNYSEETLTELADALNEAIRDSE